MKAFICFILPLLFLTQNVSAQFIYPNYSDTLLIKYNVPIKVNNKMDFPLNLYYSEDTFFHWKLIKENLYDNNYDWVLPYIDSIKAFLKYEQIIHPEPILIKTINNSHSRFADNIDVSDNGKYFASIGNDKKLKIWSCDDYSNKLTYDFNLNQNLFDLSFIDTDRIAVAVDSSIIIFSISLQGIIKEFNNVSDNIIRDISVKDSILIAASYDGKIYLINFKDYSISNIEINLNDQLYCASISHDLKKISCAGALGNIYVFELINNTLHTIENAHGENNQNKTIWCVDFNNDSLIVSAGVDSKVKIWNFSNKNLLHQMDSHSFHVRKSIFSNKKDEIITCSLDSSIRLFNSISSKEYPYNINFDAQVTSIAMTKNSDTIYACGRDGSIKIWRRPESEILTDYIEFYPKFLINIIIPYLNSEIGKVSKLKIEYDHIYNRDSTKVDGEKTFRIGLSKKAFDIYTNAGERTIYDLEKVYIEYKNVDILKERTNEIKLLPLISNISTSKAIIDTIIDKSNKFVFNYEIESIDIESRCSFSNNTDFIIDGNGLILRAVQIDNKIKFNMEIVEDGNYSLELFNINGQRIETILDSKLKANQKYFEFFSSDLNSGVYLGVLNSPAIIKTIKILLINP